MRAAAPSLPSSVARLAADTLARCDVCGVHGPAARLAEHLRADHPGTRVPPPTASVPAVARLSRVTILEGAGRARACTYGHRGCAARPTHRIRYDYPDGHVQSFGVCARHARLREQVA